MKLHEEEVRMLQQDLDVKTAEVGNLKKELEQRHERMSQVGSLLAKQECNEMVYMYTDTAEHDVLEKNQNDHLKTRLQMEMIDCQIQLTRACLQKKDVESKFDAVKHHLQMSEKVCQIAHELYQESTNATHKSSLVPQTAKRSSIHSSSYSSTTSDDSDVFTGKGLPMLNPVTPTATKSHNNGGDAILDESQKLNGASLGQDMYHQFPNISMSQKSTKAHSTRKCAASATSNIEFEQYNSRATPHYVNTRARGKSKGS